jgi:hypothetical protein
MNKYQTSSLFVFDTYRLDEHNHACFHAIEKIVEVCLSLHKTWTLAKRLRYNITVIKRTNMQHYFNNKG